MQSWFNAPDDRGRVMRKRTILLGIVVLFLTPLYLATWTGGTRAHRRELYNQVAPLHTVLLQQEAEEAPRGLRAHVEGPLLPSPLIQVNWSVPMLPGVLLVNSGYRLAPLSGEGGTKLLWYNGYRTGFIGWAGGHWIGRPEVQLQGH